MTRDDDADDDDDEEQSLIDFEFGDEQTIYTIKVSGIVVVVIVVEVVVFLVVVVVVVGILIESNVALFLVV